MLWWVPKSHQIDFGYVKVTPTRHRLCQVQVSDRIISFSNSREWYHRPWAVMGGFNRIVPAVHHEKNMTTATVKSVLNTILVNQPRPLPAETFSGTLGLDIVYNGLWNWTLLKVRPSCLVRQTKLVQRLQFPSKIWEFHGHGRETLWSSDIHVSQPNLTPTRFKSTCTKPRLNSDAGNTSSWHCRIQNKLRRVESSTVALYTWEGHRNISRALRKNYANEVLSAMA